MNRTEPLPHCGMTQERYTALEHDHFEGPLTDEEIKGGWHFCEDWDGLLIHLDDPEAEGCVCGFKDAHRHLMGKP